MSIKTAFLFRALAVGLLTCVSAGTHAQEYPVKPIRIILPFPPGGIDPVVRAMAPALTEKLGQQVVVENRPGGNQMIGTEAVAKSAPDGYTLLIHADNIITTALLQKAPYDPMKDFEPIATLGLVGQILVIASSVPAKNLRELIAYAKAKPGVLTNGISGGNGTPSHINMELIRKAAGIDFLNVPFQGGAPVGAALLGNQLSMALVGPGLPPVMLGIKNGTILAIAGFSGTDKRIEAMPDVPLFGEAGLPQYEPVVPWLAAFAPAGTPLPIIRKLNGAFNEGVKVQKVSEIFRDFGFAIPAKNSTEDAAAFYKSEFAGRVRALKITGIKAAE